MKSPSLLKPWKLVISFFSLSLLTVSLLLPNNWALYLQNVLWSTWEVPKRRSLFPSPQKFGIILLLPILWQVLRSLVPPPLLKTSTPIKWWYFVTWRRVVNIRKKWLKNFSLISAWILSLWAQKSMTDMPHSFHICPMHSLMPLQIRSLNRKIQKASSHLQEGDLKIWAVSRNLHPICGKISSDRTNPMSSKPYRHCSQNSKNVRRW